MININAYAEDLTKRLTNDLEDNIMDHLDDNLEDIIHDTIEEEIRNCIAQAVQEAKEETYHMICKAKPDFSFSKNDKPLVKRLSAICEESNAVAHMIVVMDDKQCNVALSGIGMNVIYMIRQIIDSLTKKTNMSKSNIIAMLAVPIDPPISLKK